MSMMQRLLSAARDLAGETPEEQWALLVQNKLTEQGEPPFAEPWWELLRAFWRSDGKRVLAVGGANRSGKTTHINGMCAMPQMMFRERQPYADSDLVWPNASATIDLANLSLKSAAAICRAVGFSEVKGRTKDTAKRLEPMTVFASEGNKNSPGTIEFIDVSGNRVEYRSSASSAMGLSGYTGTGATGDELELAGWGSPAEARAAIGLMKSRLKGQKGTAVHLISRLFSEEGVLHKICQGGDNEGLMVARLGERGAEYDERARLHLKGYLEGRARVGDTASRRYSQDARLVEKADPNSFILPGWSLLPIGDDRQPGPEAAIMSCWSLACDGVDCEPGEIPIDGLFRVYGGRPTGLEGEKFFDAEASARARVMICVPPGFTGRKGAGFDPAVTLNACALSIVRERRDAIWEPETLRTWQGKKNAPLDIRLNVGMEAAELVRSAGLQTWMSDAFAFHDVQLVSHDAGLIVRKDEAELIVAFGITRRLLIADRLMLRSDDPDLDAACEALWKDFLGVLLKRRTGNKTEIVIPTLAGRHGDLGRATVRALYHAGAGDEARSAHTYSAGYGRAGQLGTALSSRLAR